MFNATGLPAGPAPAHRPAAPGRGQTPLERRGAVLAVRPRHCYLALCGHPREHPQPRAGCARSSALTRPQAPLRRGLRPKSCGSSSAPPRPLDLRLFLTKFTFCYFFLLLFSFYYLTFYYYFPLYYFFPPLLPPPFYCYYYFPFYYSFLSVFFLPITSPRIIFPLLRAGAAMRPSSAGGSGRASRDRGPGFTSSSLRTPHRSSVRTVPPTRTRLRTSASTLRRAEGVRDPKGEGEQRPLGSRGRAAVPAFLPAGAELP